MDNNNPTPKPYQRRWNLVGHQQDKIARHIMAVTFSAMYFVTWVQDVDGDPYYRDADVDLLVSKNNTIPYPQYEPVSSVEIKADAYGLRGGRKYVFVETVSNDVKHTDGWLYTTTAEYILYYFVLLDKYIMIKTNVLRDIVASADARGYEHKLSQTYSPDDKRLLYRSHGVLVPVDDIL